MRNLIKHTLTLVQRQDTKGPRAYVVNEARMSMKHKLVDSPGYEMYNQFISNLPDDKKPLFEDLQPMTNEEYTHGTSGNA